MAMAHKARNRDWPLEDAQDTASCNECTGLVPVLESGEEDAERRRLYAVSRAKRRADEEQ